MKRLSQYLQEGKAAFIGGNVPSSKNSKKIISIWTGKSACCNAPYIKTANGHVCTKCNKPTFIGKRPKLVESELTTDYREKNAIEYLKISKMFEGVQKPIRVGMYFIRDTKRKFDYNNASQIITDMLVTARCIPDDNADEIIPVFLGYHVDKENPGVFIVILDPEPNIQF